MAGTKRRSTRQAATRKRSIYAEPETDDDFEVDSEAEYQPEPEETQPPPPKRRKTATRSRKPQTRSKVKSKQQTVRSIFKVGKPRKPNSKAAPEKKKDFNGPSDNCTPDWLSLPVNILRDIFVFASQPANEDTTEARANVTWLLKSARVCRAFALPALEAYYNSPIIHSTLHPHNLLDTLTLPKDSRYIDYNVKIRNLSIDVRYLAYTAHGRPAFDLVPLMFELPQLQHMEIIHPKDHPPYRPLKIQRWTFSPMELFSAMEQNHIRLKSWRWSRDMIPKSDPFELYSTMTAAHQTKPFDSVTRLVVCGFNYEDSSEPVADTNEELTESPVQLPGLATGIAKLPSLRDLTFVSCDIVMDKFLQRLPTNLERLELSNCLEITSDMLREFFKTSGSQLRELVVNHNAALNLSFLCSLKELCPRLEVLKVDLHYYSERVIVNDAAALYDELLSDNETPSWPSTLRHIEILHMQKLSPGAGQNLFRSLIDSAPDLPDLRTLILHAHINIPWRDRVGFRDQWIERLQRVYLRQSEAPVSYLGSLKQFRLWKQQTTGGPSADDIDELSRDHTDEDDKPIIRQMSHVQVSPHKPSGDTETYSDSDVPIIPTRRQPRRSKRVADSQMSQGSKSATPAVDSDTDSEDDGDGADWRKQPEKFIQGLCDVVDVRIDNQRPRENQFTEGDFLDSEVSGDEDWHEGADSGPEESYAW